MINTDFGIPELYRLSLSRGDRRVVFNLASGLCAAMHIIPEERHLIALLGLGSECSNHQAVETWLVRQLCEHQLTLGPDSFETLLELLERKAIVLAARCA